MKVANGALAVFFHFGADDFPLLQNRRFSACVSRSGFGAAICVPCDPLCVILLRFATESLQIAVEWLRQGSSLLLLRA